MARARLVEVLPVLNWTLDRLKEIKSTVSRNERLLVEAVDGSNGLLAARSTLYDMLEDLEGLEGILRNARSVCEDFLAGKVNAKEFKERLDNVLARGAGLVGTAASLRESAYRVGSLVDAAWVRVKDLESKLQDEQRVTKVERLRGLLALGGLALGVLTATVVTINPQLQPVLAAWLGVLGQVLGLVFQLVSALLPVPT
ncbi:MAG: hypothetical protein ABGY09_06210 [Euryarchaeota archaeon]